MNTKARRIVVLTTLLLVFKFNSAIGQEGCNGPRPVTGGSGGTCWCDPSTDDCAGLYFENWDHTVCGGNTTQTCDTQRQQTGFRCACIWIQFNVHPCTASNCEPDENDCTAVYDNVCTGYEGDCLIAKAEKPSQNLIQALISLF